jgi:hypothetical protein
MVGPKASSIEEETPGGQIFFTALDVEEKVG